MTKPDKSEYAPYYEMYFNEVPDGDILKTFEEQIEEIKSFFMGIDINKLNYRYAEGKWSIKEILGHLIDTERIYAMRALCFSRNETQSLPGFDENKYVMNANFSEQSLTSLLGQFELGRKNSLEMFKSFSEEMWLRKGIANKNIMSVRAVPLILVGHAAHHMRIIKERYLT
ncbi:DinB family protein [Melioribacteraceae bacterium 4301-Me]|uniref:DinB family protein n=1 Tax=Pyranulibacter aquaticus TaxID=3163344 RepID=UPI00359A2986